MTNADFRQHFFQAFPHWERPETEAVFYALLQANNGLSRLAFEMKKEETFLHKTTWEGQMIRLQQNEPLQYILGAAPFLDWQFSVSPAVLIPRPETEELVLRIAEEVKANPSIKILDVGTGSGCIAIALKKLLPQAEIWALDVSVKALEVAQQNARNLQAEINFVLADICTFSTTQKWDVIVSNPPYIPEIDKAQMGQNVLKFEPHLALFSPKNDAQYFYKIIAEFAAKHLNKPGGRLYFESHFKGAEATRKFLLKLAENAEIWQDMFAKNRFVKATF